MEWWIRVSMYGENSKLMHWNRICSGEQGLIVLGMSLFNWNAVSSRKRPFMKGFPGNTWFWTDLENKFSLLFVIVHYSLTEIRADLMSVLYVVHFVIFSHQNQLEDVRWNTKLFNKFKVLAANFRYPMANRSPWLSDLHHLAVFLYWPVKGCVQVSHTILCSFRIGVQNAKNCAKTIHDLHPCLSPPFSSLTR